MSKLNDFPELIELIDFELNLTELKLTKEKILNYGTGRYYLLKPK